MLNATYEKYHTSDLYLYVRLCGYACLSFSDPFVYGYDVMMLNVIRYYITIKKLNITLSSIIDMSRGLRLPT